MKLGIIGTGMIVDHLLSFIHEIKEIELVHISSTKRSEAKAIQLKDEYGFKRYSTDYETLLNDEEVDTIYVALPNHLHYDYTKQALLKGKHVILEKPFTSEYEEALELKELAIKNNVFLWEAITNQYFPNYNKIKELLPELGDIKIVVSNYSQYSSRYDAFKSGTILPAFDYTKAGGSLMDLNIYNIHFIVGLFGEPKDVHYFPNIEHNIDTSGILVLEYDNFKCVCVGAKDCGAPMSNTIQGDKGFIYIDTSLSILESFDFKLNKEEPVHYNLNEGIHRMYDEFVAFEKMYSTQDYETCYKMLEHSMIVTKVQALARQKAGIIFKTQ